MQSTRISRYAWRVLAFTLAVIAWGAFVRATGSGAGCGAHWPLCNGEVLPRAARVETLIELTHRASSGVALLLVLGLLVAVWRRFPAGHAARRATLAAGLFMLTEAAIGAGLVLFELVAENESVARALWMAAHLLNTFLLVAALALTAWYAAGRPAPRLRAQDGVAWGLAGALAAVLLVAVSGAVTALGDTLFPAASLGEGVREDLSPTAHFLLRLRVLHPLLALGASFLVATAALGAARARPSSATRTLARAVISLIIAQLAIGLLNLALLAPVWLQLVHLLAADLLWIALVLLTATALALPRAEPAERVDRSTPRSTALTRA